MSKLKFFIFLFLQLGYLAVCGQTVRGKIIGKGQPVRHATVVLQPLELKTLSDTSGEFSFNVVDQGDYTLRITAVGHKPVSRSFTLDSLDVVLDFVLEKTEASLNEVVVTGTMKEVSRLASPVPVEIYTQAFFRKNPTPSVFDALQNVNGVRPQLNCNVCNTGDIHINGLEGPYTMILIDGMPIVSGLSSVYGLSGIPNFLIERIEIVKGPASSLYGSEAVGGLINIITRKPANAPTFSADVFTTTWGEVNTDLGFRVTPSKRLQILTGINYFNFNNQIDHNNDNFTDITQQDRISVFQKWSLARPEGRVFSIAGRYNYEDRWGGDVNWNRSQRGGTDRYAESIYTSRWEMIGLYRLPLSEPITFSFSANDHAQNSVYGSTIYNARQKIVFGQLSWDKRTKNHDVLLGAALRYTHYDDNTVATELQTGVNMPEQVWLPGIFFQDEYKFNDRHTLLLGLRYDHNSVHKHILTPRLAYKWALNESNILRLNAGTGFRVVSLFTEEHAAISGSREVIVTESLRPERSYNVNLNYIRKIYLKNGSLINLDVSAWYTHFNNQIIPDYTTDPEQIIYGNLNGHSVSRGLSANLDMVFHNGLKVLAGLSLMDVFSKEGGVKNRPLLTERWTGTWSASYDLPRFDISVDYTGNIYGPMKLPVLGADDPRSSSSPVWGIQNLQVTHKGLKNLEVYAGVKNLLNWTPGKNEPFLIARSNDPFNKQIVRDAEGRIQKTAENPYGLSFDPSYVYAPNQGIRGFLGVRLNLK